MAILRRLYLGFFSVVVAAAQSSSSEVVEDILSFLAFGSRGVDGAGLSMFSCDMSSPFNKFAHGVIGSLFLTTLVKP